MSEEIEIRAARVKDAAALSGYLGRLGSAAGASAVTGRPPAPEAQRVFIRKALAAERAFVLLAWAGEELVGMVEAWAGDGPEDLHAASLGISVAAAWRGRGLGRRLMIRAIERARAWEGFCRIELAVEAGNAPAVGLYESLGFVLEGRRRKALSLGGRYEDLLVMALVW